MRLITNFLLLIACVVCLRPHTVLAGGAASHPFAGEWKTSYHNLVLEAGAGETYLGEFSYKTASGKTVEGTLSGDLVLISKSKRVLEGTWKQGNFAGTFKFNFSPDYSAFGGYRVSYKDLSEKYPWHGYKKEKLGYSAELLADLKALRIGILNGSLSHSTLKQRVRFSEIYTESRGEYFPVLKDTVGIRLTYLDHSTSHVQSTGRLYLGTKLAGPDSAKEWSKEKGTTAMDRAMEFVKMTNYIRDNSRHLVLVLNYSAALQPDPGPFRYFISKLPLLAKRMTETIYSREVTFVENENLAGKKPYVYLGKKDDLEDFRDFLRNPHWL